VEKMSIDSSNPEEFLRWCQIQDPTIRRGDFVPRAYFGEFLKSKVRALESEYPESFRLIPKAIERVNFKRGSWEVKSKDQKWSQFDWVIHAEGYGTKMPEVFSSDVLNSLHSEERIIILGTGLTAIDVVRTALRDSSASLTLISRHGLLPRVFSSKVAEKIPDLIGLSPLQLLRVFRMLAHRDHEGGAVAEGIRPQAARIWRAWGPREKQQFLRHLKTYWNVFRHRVPPQVELELKDAIAKGRLSVVAGRIEEIRKAEGKVKVRPRGALQAQEFRGRAIDARVLDTFHSPLDELLPEAPEGVRVHRAGFALGPVLRKSVFETTAIREIREQSEWIAHFLSVQVGDRSSVVRKNLHLSLIEESYLQHLFLAIGQGFGLIKIAIRLWAHGVFPSWYSKAASEQVRALSQKLARRNRSKG
jgi:uncharacterized NAD(P)/FAD-binding protein YdhS